MATARTIINPNNAGSIKFAANQAGIAAGVEQGWQIIDCQLVPSPNLATAPGTYGAPPAKVPGKSSFDLVLKYFQDWGTTDSFSEYLLTNDGVLAFFRFDPADTGVKGMEGPVYISSGAYGGDAGGNWESTVTLSIPVTPTVLAAT